MIGNVLRAAISVTTIMLIARWLGPKDYGRMAFLLGTFIAINGLLDLGSSAAFFTFISKRHRSSRFVSLYWKWVAIQFLFALMVVGLLPDGTLSTIWQGESRLWIVLALIASFMQQNVWPITYKMAEAQRETVKAQKLFVLFTTIHLAVVLLLWNVGKLAVPILFVVTALEWGMAGWMASRIYQRNYQFNGLGKESSDSVANVFQEFWLYCLPCIPYAWAVFASQFADRWMLQHFGGAEQQAYYGLAAHFSAISLIATTSVLHVLWKEVAEANERGNDEKVQWLYQRANRILFMFGVLISCFLIPWAKEIITLALGKEYVDGAPVMTIMFLYPVYQTLGQINGTMFYAMEMTRPYVIINIVNMIISIVTAYFLLAPADAILPGLGLGSTGLALKMTAMGFVSVNFSIWWLARKKKWDYPMGYQLVNIAIFMLAGFAVYHATNMFIGETVHVIIRGCIAGTAYIALAGMVLYRMPVLIGMNRNELIKYVHLAFAAVR